MKIVNLDILSRISWSLSLFIVLFLFDTLFYGFFAIPVWLLVLYTVAVTLFAIWRKII